MAVCGDGMLHRSFENFFFRSGNFERAVFLTWMFSAVD